MTDAASRSFAVRERSSTRDPVTDAFDSGRAVSQARDDLLDVRLALPTGPVRSRCWATTALCMSREVIEVIAELAVAQ